MHNQFRKGRGALSNPEGRYESTQVEAIDDGWQHGEPEATTLETTIAADPTRTIIARNQSPDVPFEQSINPFRGCEHGCVYCYARPSHAYLNLSPGLDFETQLFYKSDAAKRLEIELRRPRYRCKLIAIGANTDPYQPIERKLRVTRSIIEVLQAFRHPFSVITKSALITRDADILAEMASDRLASAMLSVTTLDSQLKRTLEPRTASPAARLNTISALRAAGVPVGVLVAPVIPTVNDHELERILEACSEAGALSAGYVLLRLPYEVKDLFREWLDVHLPLRATHVMNLIHQMRGGKDNDPRFGHRMRGSGVYADLIEKRFKIACRRYGLNNRRQMQLDTTLFRVPQKSGDQMSLL